MALRLGVGEGGGISPLCCCIGTAFLWGWTVGDLVGLSLDPTIQLLEVCLRKTIKSVCQDTCAVMFALLLLLTQKTQKPSSIGNCAE